ncbi:unnamed protein product [Didymodactylos carnosus]|uniref:Uncharacterized protein n=1 Tax=Didymodactylos carnosus TaxID=1234261 RepID=A0A815PIP2_9BILA|nr:unnamed protein product [Didymodactylos carnosus]CAF1449529.1 unnamed protein product [Didymodactylos carnosus]CAF4137245.1 unnamed protein product [Didymodactylos carnosus]CAF4323244.1 unnamed protein product [Didymodactylos carnosus]
MTDESMAVFLCVRPLEDHIGPTGYKIEKFIWGDGRASHAFLMVWPLNDTQLTVIEIEYRGVKKMILSTKEVDGFLSSIVQIEFLGLTSYKLDDLINNAKHYIELNPHYNAVCNNCRTLVEYLLNKIPEFCSLPREKHSVLEYYHQQSKINHKTQMERFIETNGKKKLYKSIIQSLQNNNSNELTQFDSINNKPLPLISNEPTDLKEKIRELLMLATLPSKFSSTSTLETDSQ